MRLLGLIVRVLLILFVIRMIVVWVRSLNAPRRAPSSPARGAVRAGGDLVRDPQCGTYVPRINAIGALVSGKMEYFCSTSCRDQALGART